MKIRTAVKLVWFGRIWWNRPRSVACWRAEFAALLAAGGRRRILNGRTRGGVSLTALSLVVASPRTGPRALVDLVKTRYLRALQAAEERGSSPTIPFSLSVAPTKECGLDGHSALALSNVYAELGLMARSLQFREIAVYQLGISQLSVERIFTRIDEARHGSTSDEPQYRSRSERHVEFVVPRGDYSLVGEREEAIEANHWFESLIADKHVVIVGGSSSAHCPSAQVTIEQADVVVQLKLFAGRQGQWDGGKSEVRADVVYYVGLSADKITTLLRDEPNPESLGLHDTKLIVFLSGPPRKPPSSIRFRALRFNPQFLQGSTQIGQRAVLDILTARPRRLSLVCFDGYLSDQVSHAFRQELSKRTTFLRSLESFSGHDIFANREILQCFWRAGLIDVDQTTQRYLELSDASYAQQLDDAIRRKFGKLSV